MSLRDQISSFADRRDWTGCDEFLASHPPGDDPGERSSHAYWSVRTPMELQRPDEALRRLDQVGDQFQSRCLVAYLRSEIFWQTGNRAAAIEALRSAPWGEEMDTFPALAKETMFLYCYFLAIAGREPPPKLVDAIADDYRAILFDGRRVDKMDLLTAIARNRTSR